MVNLFAKLIIDGRRTIDDVPANIKADVEARLKELGYEF